MIAEYSHGQKVVRIRSTLIHSRMEDLMITEAELAEAVGVSEGVINHIIANGACRPIVAGKLACTLGFTIWELIE